MTAPVATNVLVYRFDPRNSAKQRVARALLREGIEHGTIRAVATYQLGWFDAHMWAYAEH